MSFDLDALIHRVMDDTDLVNPGEITAKVLDQLPDEHVREALRMTLRQYVTRVMTRDRIAHAIKPALRPEVHNRSTKVLAIREYGRRWLRDREHVGSGTWKLLGECTYADLFRLAEAREQAAAQYRAKAEKYRRLARELQEYKAQNPFQLEERGVDLDWWEN